jgi:hypothetical protein
VQELSEVLETDLLVALHCHNKIIHIDVGMSDRAAKWPKNRRRG